MSPAPLSATTNQGSYGGVAGQNVVLCKHPQQPLAPVERARCPERLWERWTAKQKCSWKRQEYGLVALKSANLVLYLEAASPPHLAARAHCHPDALPPGPEGVSPLLSCELVEGSSFLACPRVSVTGQGVSNCPVIPVISHQCMTWDHSSVDLYPYSVPF
jgi:hypothetical protein